MPGVTRLADVITTWGRALAEDHPGATALGDRCITVFPPVDGARFASARDRCDEAREELGIPPGAIAIGTVGNRNRAKGHDLLVEAAGLLAARRDDIVFRILGAPSTGHEAFEQDLHDRAAALDLGDRLRWVDPGSRVADLIGAFDIFTMTSPRNSEGMPTAILEAMAAGLPVVSTDSGAVREEVVEGETGFVIEPGDPAALAQSWENLADDPALRDRLGAEGSRLARERFDLRSLAAIHKRAYDLAVAHRAQAPRSSS
jgi:glycosyltransferase involved in cell wall biosynthesis